MTDVLANAVLGTIAIPGFTGSTLVPGQIGYDDARRVYNAMVDRRPALIARCSSDEDVAAVVRHAVATGQPLSVYGGGHGVTGSAVADGGICIDLRGMKQVLVDASARTVRASAGLTWGELDEACQAHGLAVTGGRVSTTGVGGLALGSGSGWLERALGFTCDNLIAAHMVTAGGVQVTASRTVNADLFWAIRGGGGNFGIVTQFVLRLHQVGPTVLGGQLLWPASQAGSVVRAWRDLMLGAPEALGSGLAFITAPVTDDEPEGLRGRPAVTVYVCWSGRVHDGHAALAPLLSAVPPAADLVRRMPYLAVQRLLDDSSPAGLRNHWTADYFEQLPDRAVDLLVPLATRPASPMTQVIVLPGGGAVARVPEEATAFARRDAPFSIHYLGMWSDPADDALNIASINQLAAVLKPWTTGTVYVNFIGDEGLARIEAGYGAEHFARLRETKRDWDPDNVFRHNQNIPPAAEHPHGTR
jgi:FAD/FMN-containing dehydrogenase